MKHAFGSDGKCVACGQTLCDEAFWAGIALGIGQDAPPAGTYGLRLRGDAAPQFLPVPPAAPPTVTVSRPESAEDILANMIPGEDM